MVKKCFIGNEATNTLLTVRERTDEHHRGNTPGGNEKEKK